MTVFYPAMAQPKQTDITMCPGLFCKVAVFAKDTYIPQHSHAHEHLSLVAHGAVRVWCDGMLLGDFKAPAGIVIKARSKHLFLALQESTVCCIHRVGLDGEPEIVDEHHLVEPV